MSARQREWARGVRARLIASLGGRCAACGDENNLTLDCKQPCGDRHHKLDQVRRATFYARQHAAGNLQVLCDRCNTIKNDTPHTHWLRAVEFGYSQLGLPRLSSSPPEGIARWRASFHRTVRHALSVPPHQLTGRVSA